MPISDERAKKQRGVLFQYFEWERTADVSLWRELRAKLRELANLGVTAVWMPPPYKTADGPNGEGYSVYDMFDLGEFDQKGAINTKYGTKDEFLAAVAALRDVGISAYVDVVFNHRLGADETEEIEVEEIPADNRHHVLQTRRAKVWSRFTFPGRNETHSSFQWNAQHFNAFDYIEGEPTNGMIYRVKGKQFSNEVDDEHGNFDFLMGADVDLHHPEVREDLFHWGRWIIDLANIDGFRLDAVKHIPSSFVRDWLRHVREQHPDRELFAVAEYWKNDLGALKKFLHETDATAQLFDVPLHFRFHEAAKLGRDFDLRTIFDGTLVQIDPFLAVTFVDNHDTQPGQSLESPIDDWFKQHAYALTMLRKDGYPVVFYRDYFGPQDPNKPGARHVKLITDMLQARKNFTWGEQHDYFDHANCIGWIWTGDDDHPGSMAVLLSNGDNGTKTMNTRRPGTTYRDITGHIPEPITTDDNGEAEFTCPGGKVSIWCSQ